MKKIETAIRADVEEATKKAKADKEVGMDELAADVYSKPLENVVRGVSFYQGQNHKNVVTPLNLK